MPVPFGQHLQEPPPPPKVEVPVIITPPPAAVQQAPANMCTGGNINGGEASRITGEISAEDVRAALKHTMESEASKKKLPSPTATSASPEQSMGLAQADISGKVTTTPPAYTRSRSRLWRRFLRQLFRT